MPRKSIPNRRARRRPLLVEALEARQLLTDFKVVNTNDSGLGSFRQAILDANTLAGPDQILFKVPNTADVSHY
ncbi:MAG: autotransporter outer membrane beta-barrel domain-containing protein, partial [Isosphaeraceae bacterium]